MPDEHAPPGPARGWHLTSGSYGPCAVARLGCVILPGLALLDFTTDPDQPTCRECAAQAEMAGTGPGALRLSHGEACETGQLLERVSAIAGGARVTEREKAELCEVYSRLLAIFAAVDDLNAVFESKGGISGT